MRTRPGRSPRVAALAAVLIGLAACGGEADEPAELAGQVLVSAAASLTDAFTEIKAAFEDLKPGVEVVYNFAGSSTLREQILEGAPVDVFASANIPNMDRVVEGDLVVGEPQIFTQNLLQIAVPAGNPAVITGLADFGREDLLIGLCAEGVPCGDFGREALQKAGVTPAIDTNEPDVRALLTKIEAGELDAGITYVTDLMSRSGVDGVDIPQATNVVASYPIAVIAGAPNPAAARAFVDFVVSEGGQSILAGYGFTAP